jgi:hypothetical protein
MSNRFLMAILISASAFFIAASAKGQDVYKEQRSGWLQKARLSEPKLIETVNSR